MTHINPDKKAVEGEQPEVKLLHVYSQLYEHCEARIIGNREGLRELANSINKILGSFDEQKQVKTGVLFATDGEGYEVIIRLMPDDFDWDNLNSEWNKEENHPHYCQRGYRDDTDRIVDRTIEAAINRIADLAQRRALADILEGRISFAKFEIEKLKKEAEAKLGKPEVKAGDPQKGFSGQISGIYYVDGKPVGEKEFRKELIERALR